MPREYPITKTMVEAYAKASQDFNPIHLDDEAARKAGLEGPIAHGMLSLGLALSSLDSFGGELSKVIDCEAKFKDKVYVGETLIVELLSQDKDRWQLTARVKDREVLSLKIQLAQ